MTIDDLYKHVYLVQHNIVKLIQNNEALNDSMKYIICV